MIVLRWLCALLLAPLFMGVLTPLLYGLHLLVCFVVLETPYSPWTFWLTSCDELVDLCGLVSDEPLQLN